MAEMEVAYPCSEHRHEQELRLDVARANGGFVNLHLFVSPEDPQDLAELRRLLSRLQFNVMQDRFDCTGPTSSR
jgi:hypothetical protein